MKAEYDAESNGNFDELALSLIMTRIEQLISLDIDDGEGSRKIPTATMPSLDAAHVEALRGAVDLLTIYDREQKNYLACL